MNIVMDADWLSAWATAAGAVGTAVAAGIAAHQVRLTRQNSDEQTRPAVHARLVPGVWGTRSFDLIVQNHGPTIARGVKISADGEPSTYDEKTFMVKSLNRFLSPGLTFDLPPGGRLRGAWTRVSPSDLSSHRGMPYGPVEVTLQYTSDLSKARKEDPFKEVIIIDPTILGSLGPATPPHSKDDDLKSLAREINRVARSMDRTSFERPSNAENRPTR